MLDAAVEVLVRWLLVLFMLALPVCVAVPILMFVLEPELLIVEMKWIGWLTTVFLLLVLASMQFTHRRPHMACAGWATSALLTPIVSVVAIPALLYQQTWSFLVAAAVLAGMTGGVVGILMLRMRRRELQCLQRVFRVSAVIAAVLVGGSSLVTGRLIWGWEQFEDGMRLISGRYVSAYWPLSVEHIHATPDSNLTDGDLARGIRLAGRVWIVQQGVTVEIDKLGPEAAAAICELTDRAGGVVIHGTEHSEEGLTRIDAQTLERLYADGDRGRISLYARVPEELETAMERRYPTSRLKIIRKLANR